MANGGAILSIDNHVEQYMDKADLEDFHPLYQFLPTYKGKAGASSTTAMSSRSTAPTSSAIPKLQEAYKAKFITH
jgi:multiple sugar transport system substrate-binding protein